MYGELSDCVVLYDKIKSKIINIILDCSRGFGFVTFVNPQIADNVLLSTHIIDGKVVECKIAVPKSYLENLNKYENENLPKLNSSNKTNSFPISQHKKIFVGGLHPLLTENDFIVYFSQFGEVESGCIMRETSGKSRGKFF
jgi:heterogeneous nuclear ribonucleoprotein A1/A3